MNCYTPTMRRRLAPVERVRYYDHQYMQMRDFLRVGSPVVQHEHAAQRARGLLLAHLSPEQRSRFEVDGSFTVYGGRTREPYQITTTDIFNVYRGDQRYCATLPGGVPLYDSMLAQMLTIKFDEDKFLRTANRQPQHDMFFGTREMRIPRVTPAPPPRLLLENHDAFEACMQPVSVPSFFAIIPEILRAGFFAAVIAGALGGALMLIGITLF